MTEDKKDENIISSEENEENVEKIDNQPEVDQNLSNPPDQDENINKDNPENKQNETSVSSDNQNETTEHQVIHKKDGRLHIYVRQDKYKGELKSKNWVGRLYIDGKQKISSSGTPNLEEAIPILEKWFDDIHAESERQKKLADETQQTQQSATEPKETSPVVNENQNVSVTPPVAEVTTQESNIKAEIPVNNEVSTNNNNEPLKNEATEKVEENVNTDPKNKVSSILGKFKNLKFKKPSLKGIKLPKSEFKNKNNSLNKVLDFFKSKIGKSSVQGEEVIGVELTNKEIRLAQINLNKSNQWVLDKFYAHKIDIPDESSVLENAEKVTTELSLALQKSKIDVGNVAISIPVTSAIIRVVTSPLMKDEELQKAIETNSLWENLVQLTDNLDDYSIFHQVINRNEKDNTMDILFVASKLADINSYVSIVKNSGLNPVIIDVKCFALKSAVDQINQITNKKDDANLTAVLEFGLDENYLMILYDNNPIITDIFLRGQDRKFYWSQ